MFKSINKVIKILVVSDFFLNSAWGLLAPIFALFIVQNITFGNTAQAAKVAGFSTLCYWTVKSFLQIPIAKYLDKNHGEKDDFLFIVLGTFLTGLVPIGYFFSSLSWHIYIFQVLHAVGMAMMVPSWYAIFTRHIDKGKEAFEWGLDSTFLGFGVGITGAIGGIMAAVFGFKLIFILVAAMNIISVFCLLVIRKQISPKDHIKIKIPPFTPF
ncbi:MAG: hypothetical protein COU42_01765 [Candidatus Nealsonbacteria bacterium CG10_big_fil_rev_8_21_14_0_10_36_24]|uniref:Major facilitator superfamily (MFS) profile domain-containing protein n=1 Tax=Candidatus Nealsonbacteria bacterium CG10_big_fil_rev_8_21_14_0_10_36_24 TaxID=1974710 RepID=A0A2M6NSF2_9BACT|nr:MAG: hypothetical protein COU42_01765 [Candidatus Nealsonbacteria bacterium CG10_big_fil_rev_8_21_14_0_10_36_24]